MNNPSFLLTLTTIIHLFSSIGIAEAGAAVAATDSMNFYDTHVHSYHSVWFAHNQTTPLATESMAHDNNNNDPIDYTSHEMSSNNCSQTFPNCLCSPDPVKTADYYALYCNDPNLKRIPSFAPLANVTSLFFSKIDFSHSGITRIHKHDLKHIRLDLIQSNQSTHVMFHLDFERISEIDEGAFVDWLDEKTAENGGGGGLLLLRIRFSNSHFNYVSSTHLPFKGLRAFKLHFNNISNEYLLNTMFDESRIVELLIENMSNFVGFRDLNHLPSGKLLGRFVAIRSYKIDSLCSHALPSFVDQEAFSEITIKKCSTLKSIKPFTFFKYPHLKQLLLAGNNFTAIHVHSLSHLTQLELLDLSYNPINSIEDMSFKDLSSLRRLYLESTLIKVIQQNTLTGLVALIELKLVKTNSLTTIDGKAFRGSCSKTLKDLSLKDTNVSLIESVMTGGAGADDNVWLNGLSLNSLNIESTLNSEQFELHSTNKTVLCKLNRYLSPATLVGLQRSQACNCLIYFIYLKGKSSFKDPFWEYKTPVCYRTQIEFLKQNHSRSFRKIKENEFMCGLDSLHSYCNNKEAAQAANFSATPPLSTVISLTVSKPIVSLVKSTKQFPAPTRTKTNSMPKLNFKKLFQVISVIVFITIFSIFCTVILLRYSRRVKKQKRSYQISRANNAKQKQNKLVLPPQVVPPIDVNLISSKLRTSSPTISRV